MKDVLLIVMPFVGIERPQVGVSTLKAQLKGRGIGCDIAYLNIPFAETIGHELYSSISDEFSGVAFTGEWIFARSLFPNGTIDHQGYIDEILYKKGRFTPEIVEALLQAERLAKPFLEDCLRTIEWDRYSVVGFTSTFEQNLPSLALAKLLKERFPDKYIVMGGGNCTGPMGIQLHKSFPFLDCVFTGEADHSFPSFVEAIAAGSSWDSVKGFVWRNGADSVVVEDGTMITDLDALPYPDYDDFFAQFSASPLSQTMAPTLQIETARGCWWGAKNHCTFCGLNTDSMAFRAKSEERALNEILYLTGRHGKHDIFSVDNIISMKYFKSLLPELRRRRLGIKLFYETKANLTKEHVKLLADAGVTEIQPGIESFSAHVLKLMRKGVSPLQNAQLLKLCKKYGVQPQWNLLIGFPGETQQDYSDNLSFVQALSHLSPPVGCGALRLDRFSPYFNDPEQFGIRDVRPMAPYRYLYPFDNAVLHNIAYFFDCDFDQRNKVQEWGKPLHRAVERWQRAHKRARLQVVSRSADTLVVQDTRPNATQPQYVFRGREKRILEFCQVPHRISRIQSHLENGAAVDANWLQGVLNNMVRRRLMVREEDRYLSVVMD